MAAERQPVRVRSVLWFLLIAGLGVLGFLWYQKETEKDRKIEEQARVIGALAQKLDRAWAEDLVADVRVESMEKNRATGKTEIKATFAQYSPGTEKPVFTKQMTLLGDEIYIDALVVKFERKIIEEGDGLKGRSLLLFRRAFGDRQEPADGVPLFQKAADGKETGIPEALQVDQVPSQFEKDIWSRFWTYANDIKSAEDAGIRLVQGEAPHVRAVPGQVYKLTLRRSGGLEITPRLPGAMVGKPPDAGDP